MSFNNTMNTTSLNADSVPAVAEHHVHRDNEPLPTHTTRATDYSTDAIERGLPGATTTTDRSTNPSSFSHTHNDDFNTNTHSADPDLRADPTMQTMGAMGTSGQAPHRHHENEHSNMNAGIMDRPEFTSPGFDGAGNDRLNKDVHSHHAHGERHADREAHRDVEGSNNAATGKVGFGDKVIGKTQELAGKVASNPTMQEKGEIRRTEGKAGLAHRDV